MYRNGEYTYSVENLNHTDELHITVFDSSDASAKSNITAYLTSIYPLNWDINTLKFIKFKDTSNSFAFSPAPLQSTINNDIHSRLMTIEGYLREINERGKKAIL